MRLKVFFVLCCVLFSCVAFGQRKTYVCYYDISKTQDTEISVINLLDEPAYFVIRIYDCYGKLVYSDSKRLESHDSTFYRIAEKISKATERWGLVAVETDPQSFLALAVEYYRNDAIVSIDNIIEPIPTGDTQYWYWYCIYHVEVGNSDTGVIIMNPWWENVSYTLWIFDEAGKELERFSSTLSPRASDYYDLEEYVAKSSRTWGVINIRASRPIAVACEYYQREGSVLEIDNVVDYYGRTRRSGT